MNCCIRNAIKALKASIPKGYSMSTVWACLFSILMFTHHACAASIPQLRHTRHRRSVHIPVTPTQILKCERDTNPWLEQRQLDLTVHLRNIHMKIQELKEFIRNLKGDYIENRGHGSENFQNIIEQPLGFRHLPSDTNISDMHNNLDYELKLHHENLIKLYEMWRCARQGEEDYDTEEFAPSFRVTTTKLADILCQIQRWMAHHSIGLTQEDVYDIKKAQNDIENLHLDINTDNDYNRKLRDGMLMHSTWSYLGNLEGDVDSVRTSL